MAVRITFELNGIRTFEVAPDTPSLYVHTTNCGPDHVIGADRLAEECSGDREV